MRDATQCVHHPEVSQEGYASLAVPTHRASTIVYPDGEAFLHRAARGVDGYTYGLHGTPTTRVLAEQITRLQGGLRSLVVPSGQAAISIPMLTLLVPGDRVLIPDNAYPPVRTLGAQYLAPRGIEAAVYDPMIGAGIADLIDDRTRLVWIEAPGSGTMEVADIPALVTAAKARGVLTGCDNTWATPLLFKPLAHGVDIVAEALTKYAGGHSDLLLGSITVADMDLYRRLRQTLSALGIGVSPDECALALRGIETMAVRLAHCGRVAEDFARRLAPLPQVEKVLHPALPECPGHEAFRRDFKGASGVFSLVLTPESDARLQTALSGLRVFSIGASWGGTHSLIAPMGLAPPRSTTPWPHRGPLVRLSIGLEDAEELWEDLAGFLARLAP
ncbi:trans-sulfuration enzyme family protein [Ancylobacter oerskovii]|uniref:Trans-sulfuration enzyme family protein n=1 Tax=Ancylobacter oerskovii TaxID=459519 RepID=A0ABW4YY20_9HYPH|nr:PLP-dependent transferase [Ancylobacter oerskovii]MBS7541953.1 PLP-dependent transferase [Ancylobacter oerskovii]